MRTCDNSGLLPGFSRLTLFINGNCMEPVISDGEQVIAVRKSIYFPGDIVVFRNTRQQLVCHRLLGYLFHAWHWKAITQADNVVQRDGLLSRGNIIGKVIQVGHEPLRVPLRHRLTALWHLMALASRVLWSRVRQPATRFGRKRR